MYAGTGISGEFETWNDLCCIWFDRPNKVSVIGGDGGVHDIVKTAVDASFGMRDLAVEETGGILCVELKGMPFEKAQTSKNARRQRLTSIAILSGLYSDGWDIIALSRLSYADSASSDWLFHREHTSLLRRPCGLFAVVPSDIDMLYTVGASSEVDDVVQRCCRHYYRLGVAKVDTTDSLLVKFVGLPWLAPPADKFHANVLVLGIIIEVEQVGCRLLCSADLKDAVDTLYFMPDYDMAGRFKPSDYFLLSFDDVNEVQLVNASNELLERVRDITLGYFELEEQRLDTTAALHVYKIKSSRNLWVSQTVATTAKYVIDLLTLLIIELGYSVMTSIRLSKKSCGISSLLFCRNRSEKRYSVFGCICFRDENIIRVPLGNGLDGELKHIVKTATTYFGPGVKSTCDTKFGGKSVFETVLNGSPWKGSNSVETSAGRNFLVQLLRLLDAKEISVVCSLQLTFGKAMDSWFVGKCSEEVPSSSARSDATPGDSQLLE